MNTSVLVIFADPNGAGKTTYAEKLCAEFNLEFVNPDLINLIKAKNELEKGKNF